VISSDHRPSSVEQVFLIIFCCLYFLQYLIALANLRLFQESGTNSFEDIESFKLSSVGDVVDCDGWVNNDAQLLRPFFVLFKDSIYRFFALYLK
jgi:hypothetical protein